MTNTYGEALPPLFILDSKAKFDENYKIDPRVCIGLPEVVGKYGLNDDYFRGLRRKNGLTASEDVAFSSSVSVRRKGGMTTSLWRRLIEDVFLPLYPNTSRVVTRCAQTGKMVTGPLIVKTDAGPGRLSKEAESWEFRQRMFEKGVYIMLGLPNATAATQEMDQGYAEFQPAVKRSTERVVSRKLADRVAARRKAQAKADDDKADRVIELVTLDDLDAMFDDMDSVEDEDGVIFDADSSDADADSPDDDASTVDGVDVAAEQCTEVTYKNSVCSVGLGNLDLGNMVNGYPGDPLEFRPFDNVFQRDKILGWWRKVGFLPMTRNAVNDPKVRHEVGKGGAPEEEGNRLVLLEEEYKAGAQALSRLGYNGNIFDIELPRVKKRVFTDDEESKIKALMVKGVINRSGALCHIGECIINGGLMLEAHSRLEENKKQEEKDDEEVKKMKGLSEVDLALFHYGNWVTKGKQLNKKN